MVTGRDNKPRVRTRQLEGLAAADGAGAQHVLSAPCPRVLGAPCHSRTPVSTCPRLLQPVPRCLRGGQGSAWEVAFLSLCVPCANFFSCV